MVHHDLVVLGAGPGGYVAAVRAAQLGLNVAIVEKQYWGGVCLNVGCVPAKALIRNAEIARVVTAEAGLYGITGVTSVDYGVAFDRSRKVSDARAKGVNFLMRKNNITQYDGTGTFEGPRRMRADLLNGSEAIIDFDHAIIATGSTTRLLPGVELSPNVVTYKELILSRELPSSIVIVGAGAIGLEFAYILRNYGVDVTVIEYADRPLPNEDVDISKEVSRQLRKLGVQVLTSTRVASVVDKGPEVALGYLDAAGAPGVVTAAKVLIAVGFSANVSEYGLETTGVELTDRGAIAIDGLMRTNVPHIFAIGDVTAKLQLAHVAEAQGLVAAETIAGAETLSIEDYRMMPRATYIQPQVASFGLTERQARDAGHDVVVATFPMVANAKAQALGDASGFVKLIADREHLELLGGHLIGHDVSELLPELTLAQKWDLTALELARNVHTHPSLSEALQDAFHGLEGHYINI
ncbi:dihydrolipoyl dehydrogenase [Curtobacterium flaccumfaciens]|uniref:dihydrolipoyl dehydrogenase n=1 Tax=Curtobacterium flaccumfaciens TaxID=2035 RepID=UPI001BE0DFD4|nr:dihydrolipoyl dehydrogenase [Curtobacterium flaccumfaciens]MBT1583817.1 dihydrolipoyl dehydrogenase [Curtobacterium flaccumfaciens pv. flaccumfaciens]MCX2798563.1 dihydrolipoyl dehydrogenase [Curtobacterium flaccumfaciens pv. flaccumfaciens]